MLVASMILLQTWRNCKKEYRHATDVKWRSHALIFMTYAANTQILANSSTDELNFMIICLRRVLNN